MPGGRWFEGARLNYAEAVLAGAPEDRPALIAVAEQQPPREISRAELRGQVGALAAALRELGVGPGDRVAAYLPNIPEAVVALLATASLGAVWTSCAPDFGLRSVLDRLGQVEPTVLIAVDGYRWGGREHDRRDVIAQLREAMPSVRAVIVVQSLYPADPLPDPQAVSYAGLVARPLEPVFEQVEFSTPLWVLFSSGTTGLPKGIVHSHGGIVVEHLKALGLCLDLQAADTFFFHSSTSWMAWNFLVGGLLHGSTVVLYDGSPAHASLDALWQVAVETRASVFGMGSAYAAACAKAGLVLPPDVRAHLRTVIPTGSPLPSAGWRWLSDQLSSSIRIDSICGGTDVCTAFFGGSPLLPVWQGKISTRWLGVAAAAYDPHGQPVIGRVGEFVVSAAMPSMPVAFWQDPDGTRYRSTYFDTYDGIWRQGDWLTVTERGSVIVSGRSDATLNRGASGWDPPKSTVSSSRFPRSPTASSSASNCPAVVTPWSSSSSRPRVPASTMTCANGSSRPCGSTSRRGTSPTRSSPSPASPAPSLARNSRFRSNGCSRARLSTTPPPPARSTGPNCSPGSPTTRAPHLARASGEPRVAVVARGRSRSVAGVTAQRQFAGIRKLRLL